MDTQYNWQSRQIVQACQNCVWFVRKGQSNNGKCTSKISFFANHQMFKDSCCGSWEHKENNTQNGHPG